MTRLFCCVFAIAAAVLVPALAARAQQLEPGARAGNSYVPSTHTPGCGGIMCDSDDPRRAAGAPPPPPCQGLLCSVSPYGMQTPVTATDVQRMQEERARAASAPAAVPPARAATGTHRHKRANTAKRAAPAKSVAARAPDPGAAVTQAR